MPIIKWMPSLESFEDMDKMFEDLKNLAKAFIEFVVDTIVKIRK